MAHYYFDLRNEHDLTVDDDGLELRDIEAAQVEAARTLGDMARDAVRSPECDSSRNRRLAIEVRDITGPLLRQIHFRVRGHLAEVNP
jgi:hypothetical protein